MDKYYRHVPHEFRDNFPKSLASQLYDMELYLDGYEDNYILESLSDSSVGLKGYHIYEWSKDGGEEGKDYSDYLKFIEEAYDKSDHDVTKTELKELIKDIDKFLKKKVFEKVEIDIKDNDQVLALAEEMLSNVNVHEGYSGRGMYGKESRLAFTSSTSPRSESGRDFLEIAGMSTDNMGMDYIYYYK